MGPMWFKDSGSWADDVDAVERFLCHFEHVLQVGPRRHVGPVEECFVGRLLILSYQLFGLWSKSEISENDVCSALQQQSRKFEVDPFGGAYQLVGFSQQRTEMMYLNPHR